MSENPFFQFYPSDWLAGTRGLTAAETGVYITLIAMMYEAEGPIANDPKRLARLCGSTSTAFCKAVAGLIETGKIIEDERGFFNRRVEIEIEKRSEKRATASASATARWEKDKQKQRNSHAIASETQCERNANQKPEPEKKEIPNGISETRGSRLPAGWLPDEVFARQEGLSASECQREAEKFRDYWLGQAGVRGIKRDWSATWRNWVRKVAEGRSKPAASRWTDSQSEFDPYRNVDCAPPTAEEIERWKAQGLS